MTVLNAGRIAVGLAHLVAPAQVGAQWFGRRAAADPATQVAIRAMAIREIALGAATIGTLQATGTSGKGFKVLAALGVAADVVDAAATAGAAEHLPARGRGTIAIASIAALAGVGALTRP